MTVCIAAICENGKSIVMAADRFRWHPTANIEAEVDESKYRFLSDQMALMGSGNSHSVEAVLRRARTAVAGLSAVDAAARILDACQAVRD